MTAIATICTLCIAFRNTCTGATEDAIGRTYGEDMTPECFAPLEDPGDYLTIDEHLDHHFCLDKAEAQARQDNADQGFNYATGEFGRMVNGVWTPDSDSGW